MLEIEPDAVETVVRRMFDEHRNVMAETAHSHGLLAPNAGQRLAFSHRRKIPENKELDLE
jgi:hypothetical protein